MGEGRGVIWNYDFYFNWDCFYFNWVIGGGGGACSYTLNKFLGLAFVSSTTSHVSQQV